MKKHRGTSPGKRRTEEGQRDNRTDMPKSPRFTKRSAEGPRSSGKAGSSEERSNRFRSSKPDSDKPRRFSDERSGDRPYSAKRSEGFAGKNRRSEGDDSRAYRSRDERSGDRPYSQKRSEGFTGKNRRSEGDDSRPYRSRDEQSSRPSDFTSRRPRIEKSDSERERQNPRNRRFAPREEASERPRRNNLRSESFGSDKEERPKRGARFEENRSEERPGRKFAGREERSEEKRERKPSLGRTRSRAASSEKAPPTYDFKRLKKDEEKVAADTRNIRLNRYIANAGVCSRREADTLIEAGEIKVNGKVVSELGYKVSRTDTVSYRGRTLSREKLVYVLLNKPKDFITTTDDPHQRKTVMDLVANACEERIYPVGRLDRNTTGLLLLTNDGELSEKLAHPSHKAKKIYQVGLDKPITPEDYQKVLEGVVLEDGPAPVDAIEILTDERTYLGIEIHIGRNRIVRRIFEHLGYEVVQLDRVMYAGLTKKDLPRGQWRYLTQKELIRLKHFA